MRIPPPHRLPIISAFGLAALFGASAQAQDTAEYTFEFIAEWSQQTHPTSFPNNAHFSNVIGANHTADVQIWEPGGIATPGIERMAETGSNSVLINEIQAHINNELAEQVVSLGSIGSSPGTRTGDFTMHKDFPMMSLVSMIAPSPDWFVGVHGIDMRPDGVWAQDIVFDVYAYDSGTDSGINYGSANADVTPHLPITNISDIFPFTGTPRIGTFRFTLISDAACSLADLAEPYGDLNFFDVSAFLSAFSAQDAAADINNDGEFNFFDVSAFLTVFSAGCP